MSSHFYGTGVPDHLASYAAIVWLDRKREKVEARAHALAAKFRKSGEWFELTASDALGYIISAAKGLGVLYEVEDRAGLLPATREKLRITEEKEADTALSVEKWGPNWRQKEATLDAALGALFDAETSARGVRAYAEDLRGGVTKLDPWRRAEAESVAQEAEREIVSADIAIENARAEVEIAENDTTEAFRAKLRERTSQMETYRKAHPKISATEQAARDAEASAKGVVAWAARWERSAKAGKFFHQEQTQTVLGEFSNFKKVWELSNDGLRHTVTGELIPQKYLRKVEGFSPGFEIGERRFSVVWVSQNEIRHRFGATIP